MQLVTLGRFQFHKGTIRTVCKTTAPPSLLYFNSIKVRLELVKLLKHYLSRLFQFHKGTIRTEKHRPSGVRTRISIP